MTLRSKERTKRASPAAVMLVRGSMQHGYRELLSAHMLRLALTTAVIMAIAFALIGPIGFYHMPNPLARVAHSLLYTALCLPLYYGQLTLVFYFMRFRSPLEMVAVLTLATLFESFQSTAVIQTIEKLTRSGVPAGVSFLEIFFKLSSASLVVLALMFYVAWQRGRRPVRAVGLDGRETASRLAVDEDTAGKPAAGPADGAATAPVEDRPASVEAPDEPAAARVRPAGDPPVRGLPAVVRPAPAAPITLQPSAAGGAPAPRGSVFKLLPGRLGTDLVFVKSEDHYLEVHTTVGSSLIKMRFSDAVAELGDRGMQVHRSYWVATNHVVRTARNGKRTMLRLTGDQEVPVSVTHLRTVRALLDR